MLETVFLMKIETKFLHTIQKGYLVIPKLRYFERHSISKE